MKIDLPRASFAVVLVALLAIAGVAGAVNGGTPAQVDGTETPTAQQPDPGDTTPITVSATGRAEAQPDAAVLTLATVAAAESPSRAADQVAENVSQLRDALLAANLTRDQLRTVSYDISRQEPGAEPDAAGRNQTTYVARQVTEVSLDNVSRVGELIDLSVGAGANEVFGVTLTLTEETRAQLRQQALREAVNDTRTEADTIAATYDLSVTGVRSVTVGEDFGVPVREVAAEQFEAASGTEIDAGPVTVTATVTATYNASAG